MKAHWKLIVGLVIGVLVVGQAVSLRYVMAGSQDLGRAAAEIQVCHDALGRANQDLRDLNNGINAIRNTPNLSSTDKAIVRLAAQSAGVQKDLIDAETHAMASVQLMLRDRNK